MPGLHWTQVLIALWIAVCLGGLALILGGLAGRHRPMAVAGAVLLFLIGGAFLWWFGIRPGAVDCPGFLARLVPDAVCPARRDRE